MSWAKRVDLAIEACNELKLPLKIAGSGKEEKRLRALAGPTIEFVGHPSDEELEELYSRARALVFTALDEDFGIVPVEAMGYGVPVIALSQGGVLETVDDGKTGVYFSSPTKESLIQAIRDFNGMNRDWSRACKARAKKFAPQIFRSRLRKFVESRYKEARTGA